MIRFYFSSSFVLLCTSLIESAILANLNFLPAVPDLSLLCVLFFSVYNGRIYGETTGFISGLMLDFLSAGPLGINALFRTVIGYFTGFFNKTLNVDGFFIPALLGFVATIFKALLLWFISILYPRVVLHYNLISWAFLFELGCNSILCPFMFKFLRLFKRSLILRPETVY